MDHINSVRAALKAASAKGSAPPVLAIPIPGRAASGIEWDGGSDAVAAMIVSFQPRNL